MKKVIFFVFSIVIVNNIFAHTGGNVEYTCPLCGRRFESYTQFSYTIFGQNLDLRRYGAAIIPSPIPKCISCNFVFSDDFFSEEEIIVLKEKLKVNNIFEKEPDMPNHYYLAREAEIVNRDLVDIIWWFLSGVWENKDENLENMLMNITIKYIDKLNEKSKSYNNYQLVKLDLLRRSGKFEEALALIEIIKTYGEFYNDYIIKIIDLQIELIGNKNQDEHQLP
ncbi:MAG: hypothetical protein LBV17_01790 [Treponema sp.]|jgi:hypothetical protein|nr:hypothetical protein [Treponema sp.]